MELDITKYIQTFNRFSTRDKSKAFNLAEKLNSQNTNTRWNVGQVIRDRVVLDIDSHDMNNLKTVVKCYSNLLGYTFRIFKTNNGYHVIANEKSKDLEEDMCMVLCPGVCSVANYIIAVQNFLSDLKEERIGKEFTREQLHEMALQFPERFKATGLFSGYGNFDILHATNALIRGKYVLRISKKTKNDIYEEVFV